MTKEIQYLTGTLELWDVFSRTADFKSNEYDKELLATIRTELGFDPNCNVRRELSINNTSSAELLAAFLKSMKPFSVMLNDLLKMFEGAGARYADNNIQIEFNFEDAAENFNLDLNHFRVYSKRVIKVVNPELQLENSNPWYDFVQPIGSILRDKNLHFSNNNTCFSNEIRSWLEAYQDDSTNWPDSFPAVPKCRIERIDKVIAEIWQIPEAACNLYNMCYKPELGRRESLREENRHKQSAFYQAESDYWIGKFVERLCSIVYELKILREGLVDSASRINEICDGLEKFRDELPIAILECEQTVKQFLDILNLPVWKKRYALYSAWVATQVTSAFEKCDVRFNAPNGVLSFSFGGSVIAHIHQSSLDYALIAELRTPFEGVKGHGRIHSIQPDYSLCLGENSDSRNTVLVVECKQYKTPSKRNFTDAITDYAGGRPNAQVILVNYTPIPKAFLSGLPTEISDRVPFFNALTPGAPCCESFKKAVKDALPKEYTISLTWNKAPLDLDLILRITGQHGETMKVNYSNMGERNQFPFAHLDTDARSGYGSECIHVNALRSMKYDFYVHNYSGEETSGSIEIGISSGNKTDIVLRSEMDIDKTCLWHAFSIDHSSINVVNRLIPYTDV